MTGLYLISQARNIFHLLTTHSLGDDDEDYLTNDKLKKKEVPANTNSTYNAIAPATTVKKRDSIDATTIYECLTIMADILEKTSDEEILVNLHDEYMKATYESFELVEEIKARDKILLKSFLKNMKNDIKQELKRYLNRINVKKTNRSFNVKYQKLQRNNLNLNPSDNLPESKDPTNMDLDHATDNNELEAQSSLVDELRYFLTAYIQKSLRAYKPTNNFYDKQTLPVLSTGFLGAFRHFLRCNVDHLHEKTTLHRQLIVVKRVRIINVLIECTELVPRLLQHISYATIITLLLRQAFPMTFSQLKAISEAKEMTERPMNKVGSKQKSKSAPESKTRQTDMIEGRYGNEYDLESTQVERRRGGNRATNEFALGEIAGNVH
jgi:hypothetical protein